MAAYRLPAAAGTAREEAALSLAGPKGRNTSAQGNALGYMPDTAGGLKGRVIRLNPLHLQLLHDNRTALRASR